MGFWLTGKLGCAWVGAWDRAWHGGGGVGYVVCGAGEWGINVVVNYLDRFKFVVEVGFEDVKS